MINLREEIDSLSNFKRKTSDFVEQLKKERKTDCVDDQR